jgi:hypothetical protein
MACAMVAALLKAGITTPTTPCGSAGDVSDGTNNGLISAKDPPENGAPS